MLGRWKSSAYQLYVKTPLEQLDAYFRSLSSAPALFLLYSSCIPILVLLSLESS